MKATAVKERPILFSGSMVRAILDGRKTQTRRIVKRVPDSPIKSAKAGFDLNEQDYGVWFHCGDGLPVSKHNYSQFASCPYGQPGERLWVRETWAQVEGPAYGDGQSDPAWVYLADWAITEGPRWRPSIHMPRRASRITLEIVSVRVERLQDISEADARVEGFPVDHLGNPYDPPQSDPWQSYAKASLSLNWDKINGKGSWSLNPWVWVVEFNPCDT